MVPTNQINKVTVGTISHVHIDRQPDTVTTTYCSMLTSV